MTPNPRNRIDWPFIGFWSALFMLTCVVANVGFWLAQRVLLVIGWPGVLVVVALIGVAGVAMLARKGNVTW
jgi:hypothetical protein